MKCYKRCWSELLDPHVAMQLLFCIAMVAFVYMYSSHAVVLSLGFGSYYALL